MGRVWKRLTQRISWAIALVLSLLVAQIAQAEKKSRWYGFLSGTLRFPNSNQSQDYNNLFSEPLAVLAYKLHDTDKTRLALFTHVILSVDTDSKPYNNVDKGGIGLRYRWKVSKAFSLTFSARYDWSRQRKTGRSFQGRRFAVDAFYYKQWRDDKRIPPFGFKGQVTVFKAYANLYAPGSLVPGDDNVVLSFGAELAEKFAIPKTKLRWVLFADVVGGWDLERNNYNNKLIPAVGVKLEYPIKGGSLFAGARLRADWRWERDTFDVAPGLLVGWFKAF